MNLADKMRTRARSGVALQELVLSLAVSAVILGGLFSFLQSAIATSLLTSTRAMLTERTNHAVRQIADALVAAGGATLSPAIAPFGSSSLDFQVPAAVTADGIEWGNASRIEWQPDPADAADGVDDDGDGLVDEGRVVLRRDVGLAGEQATILVDGVARLLEGESANLADDNGNGLQDEGGLSFERTADGALIVRLTLQKRSRGGLFSCTVETTVQPRN